MSVHPDFLNADALAALKRRLHDQRRRALDDYRRHRRPHLFFQEYAAALESVLAELWARLFGGADGIALLATGGFGRGEVYPYSDVDLAAVSAQALDEEQQRRLAYLVRILWDTGLAPALKSGSTAELCAAAEQDLTADTAFLEARFLCGDADAARDFTEAAARRRDLWSFTESKLLEMQQRHRKQPVQALEPDIKNAPGGLRDIHTMLWLAKAQGIPAGFPEMVRQGIITRTEAALLMGSHRRLARLRIELHAAAGRGEERLLFDFQGTLARERGIADPQRGSETIMAEFYRAAKTVRQLNGILLPMLQGRVSLPWPRVCADIDENYMLLDGNIAAKDPQLFFRQPEHVFKILQHWQQQGGIHGIAPETLRAWWAAARLPENDFYADPANRARFLGFFQTQTHLSTLMRYLNLYGVLARYLPNWRDIVGLLQHDLFHIYPVDDHILTVLANLRRLAAEEHSHEMPFASALMREFEPKYVLYLAALLHDIAKGRNGDHAVLGVDDAQRFAAAHALPREDGELLAWLVGAHLLMSQTAQKEDFQDENVLARFCAEVGNRTRLTALYLLTVADIRGTNPEIWNSWKAQLLKGLFQAAAHRLDGGRLPENAWHGVDGGVRRRLHAVLGEAYAARHSPQEIQWHAAELARDWQTPRVKMRRWEDGDTLQVMVFMPNGARLFTRLCRIFSRHGLDIMAARAFVTAHDYILDTFSVRFAEGCHAADARRVELAVRQELEAFLHGGFRNVVSRPRLSRRARYLPIAPYVGLMPAGTENGWYTLEITAVNRNALLADITEVFAAHGVSLKHAKISTLADRVEDSFLIYCTALADTAKELAFKRDLLAVLA